MYTEYQRRPRPKILIIVGPTASGKSDIGVQLAKKFDGEVISADSRQVYKWLDIGSGKITKSEMKGVPHHLLDVADPRREPFSAGDFAELGRAAIKDIITRGKLPIIVGGTGFYIDALIGRIPLPQIAPNSTLRQELEQQTTEELFELLKRKDYYRSQRVDPNNKVRLIRSLEIIAVHGHVPTMARQEIPYDACWIGITWSDDELRERIETRLKKRLHAGMIAEASDLYDRGLDYKRMEELGLEYRFLALHLQNRLSRKELEEEIATESWRYARRQKTYWKRNDAIKWFTPPHEQKVLKHVAAFLK